MILLTMPPLLRLRKLVSDTANRMMVGGISHGLSLRTQRLSRNLPSLFVVSLPRSFSSYTYLLTRSALFLQEPVFTTFGEVLNYGRFNKGYGSDEKVPANFFIYPEKEPAQFRRTAACLDRIVEPRGFAYKDVVQPFAVAAWLRKRKEIPVLHIRRNLADVASAMLALKWLYPARAANHRADVEAGVVEGLVLADHALAQLPAERVEYDDLVRDGSALTAALAKLYPNHEFPVVRFHNRQLQTEYAKTMAGRESPEYILLERKIRALQENLNIQASSNRQENAAAR